MGSATLWSRRRPTSPPLFAPFAAALVLPDPLRHPRCDLPGDRVGVFHRKNDRVVIEEAPPKTLLEDRDLCLVAAHPHEDRRALEQRLHHRRQHLAAAILESHLEQLYLPPFDGVVVDRHARPERRDLQPLLQWLDVAAPLVG